MLFRNHNEEIVMLGLNQLSIKLAKKISKDKDVIILTKRDFYDDHLTEIDVMLKTIEEGLYSAFNGIELGKKSFFLSLSDDAEYNLWAAELAHNMGVKLTVARTEYEEYEKAPGGIDLIFNPYQLIIDHISTIIKDIRLSGVINLIPGKVKLTKMEVNNDDPFTYVKIKNIDLDDGIIIAINRNNKMILPGPDIQLFPGDLLYILYKKGMFNNLLKLFKKYKKNKKLFIFGGEKLGLKLVSNWANLFDSVIIIEPSLKRCNQLASKLEKPLILHGEGSELGLLRQEGLDNRSLFMAVSSKDQDNLLSSFVASKLGCKEVITILNQSEYLNISSYLDLKNIVLFPEVVANYLQTFLKTGMKLDKYILGDEIYTALLTLDNKTNLHNRELSKLNLPQGIIIGVIIRDDEIIIPDGKDNLQIGDKIIVFFYQHLEHRLHYIFNTKD